MMGSPDKMTHCVEVLRSCFDSARSDFMHREPQKRFIFEYLKGFFSAEESILIEAGTGVGKTLGYLLPSIVIGRIANKRVLVSTATKSLQEQIAKKDIQILESLLGEPVSFEVLKGGVNYLCLNKLSKLIPEVDKRTAKVLVALRDEFAQTSWNGDLSETRMGSEAFKLGVNGCDESCDLSKVICPHRLLKEKVKSTDLVIANHSLISTNEWLITDDTLLIFDEAHRLLEVLISKSIEEVSFPSLKGLLGALSGSSVDFANIALGVMEELEVLVISKFIAGDSDCVYLSHNVSELIENLIQSLCLVESAIESKGDNIASEVKAVVGVLREAVNLNGNYQFATWFTCERGALKLSCADYSTLVPSFLNLIDSAAFTLLTSATLSGVGGSLYGKGVNLKQLKVDSPFDYPNQASIYVDQNAPNPSCNTLYTEYVCENLYPKYLIGADSSLVLFTSRKMMTEVFEKIKHESEKDGVKILIQGDTEKEWLISQHKKTIDQGGKSVIFGLVSFSEGLDLPKQYLTRVIVTKINFPSPAEPANKAYSEFIESAGGDGFSDYALPMATRNLVQSVGRLVRSEFDFGDVIIMDNRLVKTRYGEGILKALPPLKVKQAF